MPCPARLFKIKVPELLPAEGVGFQVGGGKELPHVSHDLFQVSGFLPHRLLASFIGIG